MSKNKCFPSFSLISRGQKLCYLALKYEKNMFVFEIWSLKMHQRFSTMFFKRLMKHSNNSKTKLVKFMLSFPRQINIYTELSKKSIAFGLHTYTRRYDTKANIACPAVHLKNFIAKHYGEVILHTHLQREISSTRQSSLDRTKRCFFPLRLWKKNWHAQLVNVDTYLLNEESYQSCLIFLNCAAK
jgi:hypothetical protein